jgi:hypothetical protein
MFHCYPLWRARLVKRKRTDEGRGGSAHDNGSDTLYMERADIFQNLIKNPDMVVMIYCLAGREFVLEACKQR